MIQNTDFQTLFEQFQTEGAIHEVIAYGSGHINDTFLIRTQNPLYFDYIYQRINTKVFTDVTKLMSNICQVTLHIQSKLIAMGDPHPEWHCLTVIPTHTGEYYYVDEHNHTWAVYLYIPGQSYDLVPSPFHAEQGGKIYGQFLDFLSDMDIKLIHDTIPNFHNIDTRMDQFEYALANDAHNRKKQAIELVTFVRDHAKQMRTILQLGLSGKIPTRIIHNDTKFNNILLDKNNKGLCVIDLDTVMPGLLHYDYSDAVRTATSTAVEDEPDLSKVDIDLDLFTGFCKGFLGAMSGSISETELAFLPISTHLLPFIIGLRFLTDYINGDTYFKIHYPEQNLVRAKAQFQLVKQIDKKMPEIESIISRIIDEGHLA